MGDLKKKKGDYIAREDNENFNKPDEMSAEEQTIERLRAYIKKFYEIQLEKQQNQKKDEE